MHTDLFSLAPQSPQEKLERFFDSRPTTEELKQRNILKDSKVAPALQSKQAELERKRLEDELSAKLSIRPKPDELVDQNILSRTSPPKLFSRFTPSPSVMLDWPFSSSVWMETNVAQPMKYLMPSPFNLLKKNWKSSLKDVLLSMSWKNAI